jgi:hypothetical protein
MKLQNIPTTREHVLFPEEVQLTRISQDEVPYKRVKVDFRKTVLDSYKRDKVGIRGSENALEP